MYYLVIELINEMKNYAIVIVMSGLRDALY